jgi:hypothetical protein
MASSAAAGALQDYRGREYTHTVDIPVRWGDMDAMGQVNNVQYFVYFEQCRCDFFDFDWSPSRAGPVDLSGREDDGRAVPGRHDMCVQACCMYLAEICFKKFIYKKAAIHDSCVST